MALKAIEVFHDLEEKDFKFLADLEEAGSRFKWIPDDRLTKFSDMPRQDIDYHLDRLNKLELVEKGTDKYRGYRILPPGYDALAIHSLVEKDVIEAFGIAHGIGKEADIYDALTPDEERVAIKFNRLGLSFQKLKEKRTYQPKHGWFDASKKAAKKEYQGLKKIHPQVEAPKPITHNRHVLVMSLIEGEELAKVEKIDLPEPVLDEIIRNIKETYKQGIIHADLSEHNIIIQPNGEILIIDWPQWESIDHPEANDLLRRDLKNILKFFERKYQIERDLDQILEDFKD